MLIYASSTHYKNVHRRTLSRRSTLSTSPHVMIFQPLHKDIAFHSHGQPASKVTEYLAKETRASRGSTLGELSIQAIYNT